MKLIFTLLLAVCCLCLQAQTKLSSGQPVTKMISTGATTRVIPASTAPAPVITLAPDDFSGRAIWSANFPNPTNWLVQSSSDGVSGWTTEATVDGSIFMQGVIGNLFYRIVASGGANDGVTSNVQFISGV